MSINLLSDKYDVSTEEGLLKALAEIEKEECEVEEALSAALSRASVLEDKLRSTSQAHSKLISVKSDVENASEMVEKTAVLARDVSAKVRQLDLARCRVAECQQRVHDLIDLELCSSGVETAIKAHDYETAAGHVERYLSMEPASVRAASTEHIARAAHTLAGILTDRFQEAAKKQDDGEVERLFKLFPQIGRAKEGMELLAKYLAGQLEKSYRGLCRVERDSVGAYSAAATRALEAGGSALRRAHSLIRPRGAGHLHIALTHIHPVMCASIKLVCGGVRVRSRDGGGRGADPLSLEPDLEELARLHSLLRIYYHFCHKRIQSDTAGLKEDEQAAIKEKVELLFANSEMTTISQDILSQYLELEKTFLCESVEKAVRLSAPQPGTTASSLVDDVFYIARRVLRRAVSSGSVVGVCCVCNEVCAALETRVAPPLRSRLRATPPAPIPAPATAPARTTIHTAHSAAQAQLYVAHMCEAETGAEWAETLAGEICTLAQPICTTSNDRDQVASCAAGLGGAAASFRSIYESAQMAVLAQCAPRLDQWADLITSPLQDTDEVSEVSSGVVGALESLGEWARRELSARGADALLTAAVLHLLGAVEGRLLTNHYTKESGMCVELCVRGVCRWAGSECGGAREAGARAARVGALLGVECLSHVPDLLANAALPPQLVRDVLARRSDFKIEDIKRLKL